MSDQGTPSRGHAHRADAMRNAHQHQHQQLGRSISQATLVTQISRLERDLGGPLLERAERGRPMSPRPLGEQVLAAFIRSAPAEISACVTVTGNSAENPGWHSAANPGPARVLVAERSPDRPVPLIVGAAYRLLLA
jgi:DNA-binding transcriptional LysR family regulator